MTEPALDLVPIGLGQASIVVPTGWATVQVDGGVLTGDEPGVRPAIAAGVAAAVDPGRFASNVLLYAGRLGLAEPAEQLGPGQVWHDSRADGPVRRVVIRTGEAVGHPVTSSHVWGVVEGEAVMVVATIDTRRLDEVWPAAELVLRSIFATDAPAWEEWF